MATGQINKLYIYVYALTTFVLITCNIIDDHKALEQLNKIGISHELPCIGIMIALI